MKRIARLLVVLIVGFVAVPSYGQMSFSFQSNLYSRNVEGLSMFQLQNFTNQSVRGSVAITIRENTGNAFVMSLVTPEADFRPGINSFPKNLFSKGIFTYARTNLASLVSQTRTFPPGEYNYCFKFISSDKQGNNDFEDCFDILVEPLMPVSLTSPSNEDSICSKRPVLSWQPPLPYHATTRFRLILTEKTMESATESIIKNRPIIQTDNISSTILNYPSIYPELKEGKTYCWQVAAYERGILTSKSEVWEFTVQCKEEDIPLPQDSYRELKLLSNGNYYIANGYLKFSFQNNYAVEKLKVEILDIENGSTPIKHVPEIRIQQGFNKIDLDLTELNLTANKHYVLKVYPFNESPVEVRFIYKN